MDIVASVMNHNNNLFNFKTENQRHETILNDFQSILDKAVNDQSKADNKILREAVETFEAYFLQMMFREMRKTSFDNGNSFIPKSNAEKIFTDMLDEETAKSAARSGGIGLADMMYKQLKRQQGLYP